MEIEYEALRIDRFGRGSLSVAVEIAISADDASFPPITHKVVVLLPRPWLERSVRDIKAEGERVAQGMLNTEFMVQHLTAYVKGNTSG